MLRGVLHTSLSVSGWGRVSSWMALEGGSRSMYEGKSLVLLLILLSSSVANKGSVSGSCSAIVSEESGKGVCEVVTWTSVMNAVVVAVADEYPDDSRWCADSGTVLSRLLTSPPPLAARNGNRTFIGSNTLVGQRNVAHSCGFTPLALAYCVNADAYCTKSDVDAASNKADKAEELLFVDTNSVLNREAAIRNIRAQPATYRLQNSFERC